MQIIGQNITQRHIIGTYEKNIIILYCLTPLTLRSTLYQTSCQTGGALMLVGTTLAMFGWLL
jgi:hypothetical protein